MRVKKIYHKYPIGTPCILNRVLKVPGLFIGQPCQIVELGQTTERVRIEGDDRQASAWVYLEDLQIGGN
jgi:hypothetical protein